MSVWVKDVKDQVMDELVGLQFGNYRLLKCLGRGGFADVYMGEHIHLKTYVAIKILHIRLVESNRAAFFNEARTLAQLSHPSIIRILDFGLRGTIPYLIMDYAPNGTLRQRFLANTPLAAETLFPFVGQIASALQYAHDRKLIHRDVKPENMLLSGNNTILLSDFGVVLSAQSSNLRSLHEVAGTAAYMAPEQLQGKPQPASDQYALSVVVYEWLVGTCPFHGTFFEVASQHLFAEPPSMREKVPGISPQIENVVMTALAKEPRQRFASVQVFAKALLSACQLEQQAPAYIVSAQAGMDEASEATYLQPGSTSLGDIVHAEPVLPITPVPSLEDVKPLQANRAAIPPTTKGEKRVLQPAPVTPIPSVGEEALTFVKVPDPLLSQPARITEQKSTPVQANFAAPPVFSAPPRPAPPPPAVRPRSKTWLFLLTALLLLVLIGSVGALYAPARNTILASAGIGVSRATHVPTHATRLPVCANTFTDQFNGSTLNSSWRWNAGNEGTYAQTSQGLTITSPPGTDLRSWNMAAPHLMRSVTGDFTASVLTTFAPSKSYQGAGIVVWQDESNFIRLEHGYAHDNGGTYEYSLKDNYVRIADTFSDQNPARLPPDVTSLALRIQRHGNQFSAWMRQPSSDWQHINDSQIPFNSSLEIGLLVVNTDKNASPITATFSNFQMGC